MKKVLSLLFLVLLVFAVSVTAFGAISGQARGFCGAYGDNMEWILSDDGTLTISGYGEMENYTRNVPAPWYNYKDVITKLVFEGEVNSIGDHAFTDCSNITGTIELPENLYSIGTYAFEDCTGLTGDLVLPRSLDYVDDGAFYNCTGFDGELIIGENTSRIGHYAFYGCSGFEKDAVIPHGVYYIGNYAFKNCGVDNFFFYTDAPELEEGFEERPPFDKEIDTIYHFRDYNGWFTGEGKQWYGYTLKENNRNVASGYCGGEENGTNLQWIIDPDGTIVISGKGAMMDYTETEKAPWMDYSWYIDDVVIEEGVTTIGDYAFVFATIHNEPITLPSTLESIGDCAFKYCTNVWGSLVVPENVKSIGAYAFHGCSWLDSLVLPEGLEYIGEGAFKDCRDMGAPVVIPSSVIEIGCEAFKGCGVSEFFIDENTAIQEASAEKPTFETVDTLHVKTEGGISDSQYKGYNADNVGTNDIIASGYCGAVGEQEDVEWSLSAAGKLTITGTGKMRDFEDRYAGYNWISTAPWLDYKDKIISIYIEDGVKYIGNYAFYPLDHAANELVIPESVTGIGDFAFNGCNNLYGELRIPESVTSIGEYAFGYCYGFKGDLVIPDSVVTIGKGAFCNCKGLDGKLVLSKNLEVIESFIFSNCHNITGNLVIPEGVTSIGEGAFDACRKLSGDLIIPDSVISIGDNAFNECYELEGKLVIGSKVETIGDDAFQFCRGLTGDLIIPDSVTSLGAFAFEDCSGFDGKLVIGKGIINIRPNVFYNCENIADEVIIPANVKYINYGAFDNCGGKYYSFKGNAPEVVYEADSGDDSFNEPYDYIRYPEGNSTWVIENGRWMGYKTESWVYEPEILYGDIDGNGKINVMDANLARRKAAELVDLTIEQALAADVTGDGNVNVVDANLIRRFAAELIDEFPVEG